VGALVSIYLAAARANCELEYSIPSRASVICC